jgi:carbamoyltransferase
LLILGINAYHGDASAAALNSGQLVAAAEEERFNRIKHAAGFPEHALRYAFEASGAGASDVRTIAIARNPWARAIQKAWRGLRLPRFAGERLRVLGKFTQIGELTAQALQIPAEQIEMRRVEHHRAHLASAFFPSGFDEAALFSIDGLGDFASSMWGVGRGNKIQPLGAVTFPHSLGIYYTALTQYLGFPKYGDEYKVMGLASYGEPELIDEFRKIVVSSDGGRMGFRLATEYFRHHNSQVQMTWDKGEPTIDTIYSEHLERRLGKARSASEPIEPRHHQIAASLQRRLEEVVLEKLRILQEMTGLRKLCLAGGVAFNCVTNGKILEKTGFEDVYIQSAAGDAGLAIGAAMYVWHHELGNARDFMMAHSYWGPEFNETQLRLAVEARRCELDRLGCEIREVNDRGELCRTTAEQIAHGKVTGWFQDRMEWGPRALGNRSIVADPRRPEMRDILNSKIKRREPFRPFAPSILEEATSVYFTQCHPSPFMLMAYNVRPEKRSIIPATTHVDGTGRLQTVSAAQNPLYYALIKEFGRQTGVPVLLNTSFNENEPVVCKPEEALDCFLRTKMDVLVLGNLMVRRVSAD